MPTFRARSACLVACLSCAAVAHAAPNPTDACVVAESASAESDVRVPFKVVDGRIHVQAKVNGRGPFRFAVDTGASGIGRADSRLVEALGLTVVGETPNSDGVRTRTAATVRLDSLELDGLVRRDVEVIARDYASRLTEEQRFDGILGRDFFADGLLVLDYPRTRLAYSASIAIAPDAAGAIAYERPYRVPVSIGGVLATGHLDTGANVAAALPKGLHDRIVGTAPQPVGQGQLANGAIDVGRSRIAGPIRIGRARWDDVDVRVADDFPELLIGAHLLQHHVLAIDPRSKRVALCVPDREGTARAAPWRRGASGFEVATQPRAR